MKPWPARTRSINSGMMIHLGTLSSPVPPLSIPRFDRRHTVPWLTRWRASRSSSSFLFAFSFRCPFGHRAHQESFHLEHHRTNCLPGMFSSVPLLVLLFSVFATSEDGHHLIVLPSGRWLNFDRATGHLFFRMTYSFVDQVLVWLDLLRKLMKCLTNSGLHVKW